MPQWLLVLLEAGTNKPLSHTESKLRALGLHIRKPDVNRKSSRFNEES